MAWSDIIAILAALVATHSAVYVRWSAKATQRANEISIHNERLRLYKGLLTFRATLYTKGSSFHVESLWEFADIALLSEFYFSEDQYILFKNVVDRCHHILSMRDKLHHMQEFGGANTSDAARKIESAYNETRSQCDALVEKLRPVLRLVVGKPSWLI
jgi:hypothetical protein